MNAITPVSEKLQSLLDRVANLKLARDIRRPIKFDRHGEEHARRVAQQDRDPQ